uniref:Uncharacterized protein n=1 Tax=Nelumbo nucifera TaxID=4432 RepID=A0A822ZJS9_NELNU|nr:TPA_asm: hypothetical protein HUJ06_003213 [Nelumbo nucifera]DAD44987.1 TPA_asm: hypothetical protein HUJ06_003217 [Nelumbo nucifera]
MVLPDGTTPRAQLLGCSTWDLFSDPTRNGVSLLKIWNMNKFTGVLGVYNCQGAAWSSVERKNMFHQTREVVVGILQSWTRMAICAVFRHRGGELVILPRNSYDVFTVSPIKVLNPGFSFAPLGLIDMFNAGGAIEGLRYENRSLETVGLIHMEVKGCDRFGAFSSAKPRTSKVQNIDTPDTSVEVCVVGLEVMDFTYESGSGLLIFNLDHMPGG